MQCLKAEVQSSVVYKIHLVDVLNLFGTRERVGHMVDVADNKKNIEKHQHYSLKDKVGAFLWDHLQGR